MWGKMRRAKRRSTEAAAKVAEVAQGMAEVPNLRNSSAGPTTDEMRL